MPWASAIFGGINTGLSVFSGLSGSNAQEEAADAIQEAANNAAYLETQRYNEAQGLLSPYVSGESDAYNQLLIEMGLEKGTPGTAYLETPAYQSAIDEGIKTVNQGAAASGNLYSGARAQELMDVGQNTQNQYYNNYLNVLQGMANPTSTTNLANMGMNNASTIGNTLMSGQTQANQYNVGAANTQSQMISDIGQAIGTIDNSQFKNPWSTTTSDTTDYAYLYPSGSQSSIGLGYNSLLS